jgi:hypothetical protein
MEASLIHPQLISILPIRANDAISNDNFFHNEVSFDSEPAEKQYEEIPIIVYGQVKYTDFSKLNSGLSGDILAGVGHVMVKNNINFKHPDKFFILDKMNIEQEIKKMFKIISIGDLPVCFYILDIVPAAHYEYPTLLKLTFDRLVHTL